MRNEIGHWEMDVIGAQPTLRRDVGRAHDRSSTDREASLPASRGAQRSCDRTDPGTLGLFKTITVDNGPEFHGYKEIERATGVVIYFANPYSSWERGTNENTNGLIRQYLPKRTSMKPLTQARCNTIASSLNNRSRKRQGFRTPLDCSAERFTLS
jgi:transposase, IS30 family